MDAFKGEQYMYVGYTVKDTEKRVLKYHHFSTTSLLHVSMLYMYFTVSVGTRLEMMEWPVYHLLSRTALIY